MDSREVEIKLHLETEADARARLEQDGFCALHERAFESNEVFDNTAGGLRDSRRLLRLRQFRGVFTLTFKDPPEPGPHKSRVELETTLADGDAMRLILGRLGYQRLYRYEKFRTTYARAGEAGHAVVDETPIGVYIELEGAPEWIDSTAARLGFAGSDYILQSYGSLYADHCARCGVAPSDMVFAPGRAGAGESVEIQ